MIKSTKKTFSTYVITNNFTNSIYVGVTGLTLQQRFSAHKSAANSKKTSSHPLYQEISTTPDSYLHIEEVARFATRAEAESAETKLISAFRNSKSTVLNINDGGQGLKGIGYKISGEKNGHCTIKDNEVTLIRAMYKSKSFTQYEIAALIDITQPTVSRIINFKSR